MGGCGFFFGLSGSCAVFGLFWLFGSDFQENDHWEPKTQPKSIPKVCACVKWSLLQNCRTKFHYRTFDQNGTKFRRAFKKKKFEHSELCNKLHSTNFSFYTHSNILGLCDYKVTSNSVDVCSRSRWSKSGHFLGYFDIDFLDTLVWYVFQTTIIGQTIVWSIRKKFFQGRIEVSDRTE